MVDHLVLFKFKEGTSQENINALAEGLRGLSSLPGVVALTCGANFSTRSQGYQFGLRVTFKDKASLEHYGPSAEHQAVVTNLVKPITEDVLVVDYEPSAAL